MIGIERASCARQRAVRVSILPGGNERSSAVTKPVSVRARNRSQESWHLLLPPWLSPLNQLPEPRTSARC